MGIEVHSRTQLGCDKILLLPPRKRKLHVEQALCKLNLTTYILELKTEIQELAGDRRRGFEISVWDGASGGISPQKALDLWMSSPGHRNAIMAKGMWSDLKTVGCYKGYNDAFCWFTK